MAATASNRNRSVTRADRRPREDRVGRNIVIAAFVRAKLLGIKLLTLDARIVLAPDDGSDIAAVARRTGMITPRVDRRVPQLAAGQRADLAYAVKLLEEGSKNLDEARAI